MIGPGSGAQALPPRQTRKAGRISHMPPMFPERPESMVDEVNLAGRVPQQRPPSDPPYDPPAASSAVARAREAETRNVAGAQLFQNGNYVEAAQLFEQALGLARASLGPEHPETLRIAGNLAVTRVASGDGRKGVQDILDVIDARVQVLGDQHPDTMTARNALAVASRLTGHPDQAVELGKDVVLQRSRRLGPAHPDTLTSRMGLALALAAAGETASAQEFLGSTLEAAEEALGDEHPHLAALVQCGISAGLLRREF
jgi:tetratricopeptide (TPR) repeat protein